MDETTPPSPPSAIPWRRSGMVFLCMLVVPWLLIAMGRGEPEPVEREYFAVALMWQFAHAVWMASILGLLVRRPELYPEIVLAAGIGVINFVLTSAPSDSRPNDAVQVILGALVAQVVAFVMTLVLRFPYTVAHRSEISAAAAAKISQYSLRAIFLATLLLAVVMAALSAMVKARIIAYAEDLIPWLTLICAALLWNELFQWRLRWLNLAVCSFVWLGLWGWRLFTRNPDWLILAVLSTVIFSFPLAYRWTGWRMVRRECLS